MIRVLLVDDQPLVRAGLRTLLSFEPNLSVVGEVASGAECLHWLEQHEADVMLLDIRMPGLSGVDVCRFLSNRSTPGIILLTTFDDEHDIAAGLAAGARGFLLKDADVREIAEAINVVARQGRYIQPLVSEALSFVTSKTDESPGHPADQLTPREAEVLALMARGMSNKRIALALTVTENTVKVHVARIFHKLGTNDRLGAIKMGLRRGWLK